MHRALSAVGVVVAVAGAGSAPAPVDLQGTIKADGRPAANAVVWLDAPRGTPPTRSAPVVLDQRNLAFVPGVLAVQVGTKVEFPNNDRVFHNVFSFHNGKRFDLGLYPVGTKEHVTFDTPGLSRIFCNIHPNMAAYVMVVDSPYSAVSDAQGRVAFTGVNPGRYTYHAWRSGKPDLSGTVNVSPGEPIELQWP